MTLTLRPATPDDAPFISHAVVAALHLAEMPDDADTPWIAQGEYRYDLTPLIRAIAEQDILYSYRNTRMAEVDGQRAGCFITYDGAIFAPLRDTTYAVLGQVLTGASEPRPVQELNPQSFPNPTQGQPNASPTFDPMQNEPETRPGEYYLDSLAVVPRFRQYGVGRMLVVDALCQGRNLGFHRFTGLVAVDAPKLLAFYQSEGLQPVKQQNLFGTLYHRLLLER